MGVEEFAERFENGSSRASYTIERRDRVATVVLVAGHWQWNVWAKADGYCLGGSRLFAVPPSVACDEARALMVSLEETDDSLRDHFERMDSDIGRAKSRAASPPYDDRCGPSESYG